MSQLAFKIASLGSNRLVYFGQGHQKDQVEKVTDSSGATLDLTQFDINAIKSEVRTAVLRAISCIGSVHPESGPITPVFGDTRPVMQPGATWLNTSNVPLRDVMEFAYFCAMLRAYSFANMVDVEVLDLTDPESFGKSLFFGRPSASERKNFFKRVNELVQKNPASSYSSSDGGGCFIATAAFDSYDAAEVRELRHFRDKVLLSSKTGKVLVKLYYTISPPIARLVAQNQGLKLLTRKLFLEHLATAIRTRRTGGS